MVGQKQEQDGIIKHGSKLINAVSNAKVPLSPLFPVPFLISFYKYLYYVLLFIFT